MPYISQFFGIMIRMFFNDHTPPHFHAEYGEFEAIYEIETLRIRRGKLPRRAHSLVVEWATLHLSEQETDMEQPGKLVRVRTVKPVQGFHVHVEFEDGTSRVIDLEPFLWGPIFEPIRNDPAQFRAVKVEGGTIAWDNGADIDPDVLYYNLKPAWMEKRQTA